MALPIRELESPHCTQTLTTTPSPHCRRNCRSLSGRSLSRCQIPHPQGPQSPARRAIRTTRVRCCMYAGPTLDPCPPPSENRLTRMAHRQEERPESLVLVRSASTSAARVERSHLVANSTLHLGRDVRERMPICAILPTERREAWRAGVALPHEPA